MTAAGILRHQAEMIRTEPREINHIATIAFAAVATTLENLAQAFEAQAATATQNPGDLHGQEIRQGQERVLTPPAAAPEVKCSGAKVQVKPILAGSSFIITVNGTGINSLLSRDEANELVTLLSRALLRTKPHRSEKA